MSGDDPVDRVASPIPPSRAKSRLGDHLRLPMTDWPSLWRVPEVPIQRPHLDIDLWRVELEGPWLEDGGLTIGRDFLQDDEWNRAQRLMFPRRRQQFVLGRIWLRRTLSRYLGIAPSLVEFGYGEHGKPRLQSHELAFNLSHTEDWLLLAVSRSKIELGVDVEAARSGREFESIARRFFATPEACAWERHPPERRAEMFYRRWAQKEAYLKAVGTGLSFASNRFVVSDTHAGLSNIQHTELSTDRAEHWEIRDVQAFECCAAAVCYPRTMKIASTFDDGRFGVKQLHER